MKIEEINFEKNTMIFKILKMLKNKVFQLEFEIGEKVVTFRK